MPIDLLPLTSDWLAAFDAHRRRIVGLSGLLEDWLAQRLSRLGDLERRTRGFPTFAFQGRALSVTLHPQQHGALRAYGSAGQAWASPFVAFGRGFTRIPQAIDDELVLPNLLSAVEGVVGIIADSVQRLVNPRPSTFDPRTARASSVFGLFAMAWRGLTTSTGQLRLLVRDIGLARAHLMPPARSTGRGAGATLDPASGAVAASSGGDLLDDVARWLTGAIALLPALPDWIGTLAEAAWLRGRLWLLDTVQGIERRVFALRREVLGFMLQTLPELLREVPALVAAMATMLQWSIRYFALVARIYFEVAVNALTRLVRGIYTQINGFIDTINDVLSLVDRVLDFDLLQLIKPFMGLAGVVIDYIGVRFTVDDLIEAGTGAVNMVMYGTLKAAIFAARAAIGASGHIPLIGRVPFVGAKLEAFRRMLLRKLGLIEQIVDALFRDTGGRMIESAAPHITPMPNFYDLLFGVPPGDLGAMVGEFGRALGANVGTLFERVAGTLRQLGEVFAHTATDLARTGPAARMAGFGRDAAGMANHLYEDQIQALGTRIGATPIGPFERWLAGSGFRIIERAIPLYIAEMRAWWHQQAASGEGPYLEITATSPHILARRARLARVRIPRLTIRAGGRAHDETLVRELARRFHTAVREAYSDGRQRLAQIAGTG